MACQTFYGTRVRTELVTSTETGFTTSIQPPTTSTITSTNVRSVCADCPPLPSISCEPVCVTTTDIDVETQTIPGTTITEPTVNVVIATQLSTAITPTATTCAAPPPPAPTFTSIYTPPPVYTSDYREEPKPSSSEALSTSFSVVVVTTTLGNGETALATSLAPVLVPTGDATRSGQSTPVGAIAGGTLGGVAVVVLIVLALLGCLKRKGPLACLAAVNDDDEGLQDDYWAPAAATRPTDDEEEEMDRKAAGGRPSPSSIGGDHMVEYHASAYMAAGRPPSTSVRRSASSMSYGGSSDHRAPPPSTNYGRPPSHYGYYASSQRPSSTHSIAYAVPPTSYYQPSLDGPANLVRRTSAPLLTHPTYPTSPIEPPQRSRSSQPLRTPSHLVNRRLERMAEGNEEEAPATKRSGYFVTNADVDEVERPPRQSPPSWLIGLPTAESGPSTAATTPAREETTKRPMSEAASLVGDPRLSWIASAIEVR